MPTHDDPAKFVTSYLARVVNERDLAAVEEMVALDYSGGGHGWPQTLGELVSFYEWQAATRPDWHIDVKETIAVGECVVVRAEAGGTVMEDEPGRPVAVPTRRRVEWLAAYWVSERRIRRIQVLSLVQQTDR